MAREKTTEKRVPLPWEENLPSITTVRPVMDLLLSAHLEEADVEEILKPFNFSNIRRADENFQLIAEDPRARQILAEILEPLLSCLARSPDPDQALNFLERFCRAAVNRVHLLSYLKDSPWTLWLLARVFGSSPYLSETLIRNPADLYWVARPETLRTGVDKKNLSKDLNKSLGRIQSVEARRNILRIFNRREMLRIGVRDLLRIAPVPEITLELSDLADVLIQKAFEMADKDLRKRYGTPYHRAGRGIKERSSFSVIGMGKLGGRELNFSSDVDLIYIYHAEGGRTSGGKSGKGERISNEEFFKQLGQDLTRHLSTVTNEGGLFRVDLRLRPEGEAGPVVQSLRSATRYYNRRGSTWERLALLKARPVAGSLRLGNRLIGEAEAFIFKSSFTPRMLGDVLSVKNKIDRKMSVKKESLRNVKLGVGGIREIEFIVQSLQSFFGKKLPAILERNTLKALERLRRAGVVSGDELGELREAYLFLRDVEHKLQMVHEEQTHTLPADPGELRRCALRLGYREEEGSEAADGFLSDLRRHTGNVHRIFTSVFENHGEPGMIQRAINKSRSGRGSDVRRKNRKL
ncbi:MAG TPA: hypothetical protein VIU33_01530 [Nitrospiria bacterium]